MKLHDIVEAYIDYKHSLGMRFRSQAAVLRAFNRAIVNRIGKTAIAITDNPLAAAAAVRDERTAR
jgi:hypothetical protein